MAHRISPQAELDLDAIWYYVAIGSGSMDTADRLIDSLSKRFLLIAKYPYIGRRRDDDLQVDVRSLSVGEYVILYRIEEDDAVILMVARGSRDLEALLG